MPAGGTRALLKPMAEGDGKPGLGDAPTLGWRAKPKGGEGAGLGADAASLQPTRDDRGWIINPIGPNPWWTVLAALIPALLCTILIFMDQQITAVIVNRNEHRLKVRGCQRRPRPRPTAGCRRGQRLLFQMLWESLGSGHGQRRGRTLSWGDDGTGSRRAGSSEARSFPAAASAQSSREARVCSEVSAAAGDRTVLTHCQGELRATS